MLFRSLYLKAGTTLNATDNASLDVTVEVDDATLGTNPDDSDALAITVTPVNAAPTVALSNTTTTLSEGADTTSALMVPVLEIRVVVFRTNTLSLSGDDSALFEIVGNELFLVAGAEL